VLGYFACHQSLGPAQVTGALLVVAGGVLLTRLPARHDAAPAETVSSNAKG
jgi:drug/metabolite transporter (DMT)-like permease